MQIRSLLFAAALCGAPLAAAHAADLSTPPAKAPAYAAPPIYVYTWTGFYLGGSLGGAWSHANWTDPVSGLSDNVSSSGFMGGGQFGYNWQIGPWVLGAEGDFTGTSLRGTDTDLAGFVHSTSTYWTSTVTGRLGYAVNRVLFYAKGGVAFADERDSVTSPLGVASGTGTTTQTGWTAGAGIEYAIDPHWSARVEYDYLGFGSVGVASQAVGGLPGSVDMNIQRVMAGINYRF